MFRRLKKYSRANRVEAYRCIAISYDLNKAYDRLKEDDDHRTEIMMQILHYAVDAAVVLGLESIDELTKWIEENDEMICTYYNNH